MPKVLDEFPASARTRKPKYDYDAWLTGKIVQLTRGEDFDLDKTGKPSTESLVSSLRGVANNRGLGLRGSVVDDDTVVIQSTDSKRKMAKKQQASKPADK